MKALVKLSAKRNKIIKKSAKVLNSSEYVVDNVARNLHPGVQKLVVKNIIEHNNDLKTFYFANADDSQNKLAIFKPGQYITLNLNVNNMFITRPYSLSSSPKDALNNVYRISVKRVENGIASNYLLDKVAINDVINSLEPSGNLCPSIIRDKKHIVALAHSTGIVPYVSMAKAIYERTLDKEITIFYSVDYLKDFIYVDELNEMASKSANVNVVYICSEEKSENVRNGKITLNLIKEYVTSKFTVFASGSNEFYQYLKEELSALNLGNKDFRFDSAPIVASKKTEIAQSSVIEIIEELPPKRIRKKKAKKGEKEEEEPEVVEPPKQPEIEPVVLPNVYNIKVFTHEEEFNINCLENQTILSALETNNIKARSKCRSGECGYCRALLLWGEIKILDDADHRRSADIKFNYIHPCSTYPASDITIKLDI